MKTEKKLGNQHNEGPVTFKNIYIYVKDHLDIYF